MRTSSSILSFLLVSGFAAGCVTGDSSSQRAGGTTSGLGSAAEFHSHDAVFTPACGPGDRYAFFISLSSSHDATSCQPDFDTPTVRLAITPDNANVAAPVTYVIQGDELGSFGQYVSNGLASNQFAVSGTVTLTSYQQNTGSQGTFSLDFANGSTVMGEFTTSWCEQGGIVPCG
jgi:hypothetical protein